LHDTNAVLNRLLILHYRSLPTYLSYTSPWCREGNNEVKEALDLIAADHRALVDRLGEMIMDGGGSIRWGEFPLRYTALHDLSLDFLLTRLIEHQKQLVVDLGECADQLLTAPLAQAVALEALGAAKGHLQTLEESTHRSARTSA
jgi:hypothetical protein